MSVTLRAATVADVPTLRYWDTKPHVIASTGDDDFFEWDVEVPRMLMWRELLVAEVDGRPVGFLQIIDAREEETHYWGDIEPGFRAIDIWIGEEDDLGRGYGEQMMRLALDRCFADPSVQAVLIDPLESNVRAIKFYRRIGFRDEGPRRFGDDDCLVLRYDRPQGS